MTPNEKIKHLRWLADIYQEDLAAKMAMNRTLLSQIERGIIPTTEEFAQKAISIIKEMRPDIADRLDELRKAL